MADEFPDDIVQYNQTFHGFFGTFGTGGGAQIYYIQSALKPSELGKVTLISDIPGSEAWSVRDLFQRDVDTERVTKSILPYFRSPDKVKFFNPLTLTILPVDPASHEIEGEIPFVREENYPQGNEEWPMLEMPGIYRFRYPPGRPQFGRVEWNDQRAKIVAIDGQHRLSALKRFLADAQGQTGDEEFLQWTIPVVIFSLRALNEQSHSRILDVVRNIFIYINTAAKTPNEARQILLSDESVNGLCAQELLENSHQNDVRPFDARDDSVMPLLFFDWRGEEVEGKRKHSPAALKTIEEVRDWFKEYLLGIDFSDRQESALGITTIDPLHSVFVSGRIDAASAEKIRAAFQADLLPALTHLLSTFVPYKHYIERLRQIEAGYNTSSDVARHAFHKLRFGTHRGGSDLEEQIASLTQEILHDIQDAASAIPRLIEMDIGMRGIISAFAELKPIYDRGQGGQASWREYSEWFTRSLNSAYGAGYLTERKGDMYELRKHITHDQNESVVNYRLQDVKDSFGPFVAAFCCAYGRKFEGFPADELWDEIWSDMSERLTNTLVRGYKKEVRVFLKEEYPNGGKELTEAVKQRANAEAEQHISTLEDRLQKISS